MSGAEALIAALADINATVIILGAIALGFVAGYVVRGG
jgi:hypothetical protein